MSDQKSCLYLGEVVHRRVTPVKHSLRYKVYDLFVDLDDLSLLNSRFKFLSFNRFNLFSVYDRHFGQGTSIRDYAWSVVAKSSQAHTVKRIFMLCYPAVLGRVFNPLTTYYCFDAGGKLCLMIYEVSNTFGERHSYVMPVEDGLQQNHAKKFYVSPFNKVEGEYDFAVQVPGDTLSLGISLRAHGTPIMQAWFKGERRELDDWTLLKSFFSLPLQPLKVVAGIHWEALKLWVKGLRLVARPAQIEPNISFSDRAISKVEQQK
jgi:uncharacterized protein